MDEFNFDDNFEIGTSISKLKDNKRIKSIKSDNNDIFVSIKNLEDRVEFLENTDSLQINTNSKETKSKETKPKNKEKNNFSFNYKEIIAYILFFIILNNHYVILSIYKIPYISSDSHYINLMVRTLIFGFLIYLFKNFLHKYI